ncbi:MAG: hypothetical protein ACM3NR_04465 [Methanosarcina sp.]
MKSTNKTMNLEELKVDKRYIMIVESELPDGDTMEEEVKLKKIKSGIIEVSGFSPSVYCVLYDDGPNFHDAFTEVNWALIIMDLVKEMSDDPTVNSFTLSGNSNFEFKFGLNATCMEDIISKMQLFFKELYLRTDSRWNEINKMVKII